MDSFRPPENPNPYGPPAPPRSDPPSQRGYRGGNRRRSRDKSQDSGWRSRQYNERNLRSYRDGGSTYRDGSYCREGAASRDRRDSWGHRHYNDRSSRYGRDNNNGPSRNRQQERQPPWHQDRYHQQYQHQNGIAQNNWNSTSLAGSSGPHGHHGPHPPVSHGPTMIPVPGQHAPGLSPQLGPPGVSGHVNLHGSHVPPGPPGQIGQQAQHNQNQSGHLGHLGQHEHHERQPAQLVQPGAPGTHPVLPHYEQTPYQEPAPFQGQLPPQIPTWDQNYHPQPPGHHYQETYYHPYDHYQNQYNPYMNGADSMGYNHHMENKHAMPPQPPQPPQPPNPPHANIHMNVNNVQLTTQLRSPISPHTSYPQSSMPIQSIQPTHISQQPTVGTRSVKSHVSPIEVTPVTVKKCAELYEILSQVGEGTYGKVYKARNRETKEIVALKKIRMDPEKEKEAGQFPLTAIREIKLLQQCKHKNVVQLKEIMVFQGFVYMVFEYMAHDLTGVLANPKLKYESQHVKCLMKQTLEGLAHLHENGILHRDIKGSNILLNNRGEVKLADFGLARQFDIKNKHDYTNRVITLWYRPPELCLGATEYSCEVDLWSVGCIMMELITGKPLFQGKDEFSQLDSIFNLMGVPDKKEWPEITDLSWYAMAKRNGPKGSKFREHFEHMLSPCALQLVESLLSVNPKKRPSALKALNYTYFTTESPHACSPSELPEILGDWHEYESKQKNKKANP
ncbi:5582_t:CDS:2 [Funneliformis caledonium]|uniref:5582_t:CDS:1 n=1 Tax=Funneliformis caledonium TaxID=1117310 RepID=A0A9N9AXF7_9GLOM|nr:5582_t:CDS:2 [Funneliformis caledonium]